MKPVHSKLPSKGYFHTTSGHLTLLFALEYCTKSQTLATLQEIQFMICMNVKLCLCMSSHRKAHYDHAFGAILSKHTGVENETILFVYEVEHFHT